MRNSQFLNGMSTLIRAHTQLENMYQVERAQRNARDAEEYMRTAQPSGQLGNGRLANADDLHRAGMFDANGLFLGSYNGRMVFFNGDGPLCTYLQTGGGKGRDLLLPNLAHVRGRSLFITDVKPELAWASINHRLTMKGHKVVVFDPFNTMPAHYPKVHVNPLRGLVRIVQRGGIIETEAEEIANILLPPNPKATSNSWVRDGAVRMLALRMEYLAMFDPDNCLLSYLWRFVNSGDIEFQFDLTMMETCGVAGIEGRAKALRSVFKEAPKQFEACRSECQNALASYEPGKTLARATSTHDFEFSHLSHVPTTVYVVIPSSKLIVAAPWISMLINYAIEEIAASLGVIRTTFLLDEFPQLPPCGAILKALRLYRGLGIQLWFFAQGRFSMEGKWSRDAVKEIEDQAAVMTLKYVRQTELIKDVSVWSGKKTVIGYSKSHNGGKIETAGDSLSETSRDVLQSEDITSLGEKQILRVSKMNYLTVCDTVPYFEVDPWLHQIRDVRKLNSGEQGWD